MEVGVTPSDESATRSNFAVPVFNWLSYKFEGAFTYFSAIKHRKCRCEKFSFWGWSSTPTNCVEATVGISNLVFPHFFQATFCLLSSGIFSFEPNTAKRVR